MQRRKAFKESMKVLIDLTQKGSIWEANQWAITRMLFGKKPNTNPMHELGVFVAKQVLDYEKDQRKAAAILLLICLDFAYNSVVSFSATLDVLMKDLYQAADGVSPLDNGIRTDDKEEPRWITLQKLVFSSSSSAADKEIEQLIQQVAQATVKLPIVRKATATGTYIFDVSKGGKKTVEIKKGETVILNLSKAIAECEAKARTSSSPDESQKLQFLTSQLSIADRYGVFSPRRVATLSLTSMVTFVAQMRNPRRGHDAQGRLKRIRLETIPEGYANYMAPMRVSWIKEQAKRAGDISTEEREKIFSDDMLRPEADTYLTPTWDEFVPFPMTWKIRFDGFGKSDYSVKVEKTGKVNPYGRVKTTPTLPDFCPPWYQPQGPSTVGGTFADVVCVCADDQGDCPCNVHSRKKQKLEEAKSGVAPVQLSTGCGLGGDHGHA